MDLIQYFQQLRLLVAGVEEAIPPGQMAALGAEEADIVVSLAALEIPQAFPPRKEIMVVLEPRLRIMGVVGVAVLMQLLAPDLMVLDRLVAMAVQVLRIPIRDLPLLTLVAVVEEYTTVPAGV